MNKIEKVKDIEFNAFLKYLLDIKGYSEKTMISYGEDVADFLLFINERNKLKQEVDKDIIREYILEENLKEKNKVSINRKLAALRHFYRYLNVFYDYKNNPFETISIPKKSEHLPQFLSFDEISDLLDSNQKRTDKLMQRDQAILELLFASGLRCNEIISLKINQISFDEKQLRVIGKGNKERIVPFTEICKNALQTYISDLRVRLVSFKEDDGTVFLNSKGEKLTERGLEYILKSAGEKCGFPLKLYPHLLRHTFATELLNNHADLRTIQEFLGHSSIKTTSIYTHVSYKELKETYDNCFPKINITEEEKMGFIFDFNGTMFFDEDKHVLAWREFIKNKLNLEISNEEFDSHIHGFNNKDILEYLFKKKLNKDEIERYSTEKELIYQRYCEGDKDNLHLVNGLEKFLDYCLLHKIPIGIATASRKPNVDWYIKTFNLLKWFDEKNIIYDDGTIKKGKPDSSIYIKAMNVMDVKPSSTIVFEDSNAGILSASNALVKMVIVIRPKDKRKNIVKSDRISNVIEDFECLDEKTIEKMLND